MTNGEPKKIEPGMVTYIDLHERLRYIHPDDAIARTQLIDATTRADARERGRRARDDDNIRRRESGPAWELENTENSQMGFWIGLVLVALVIGLIVALWRM